MNVEKKFGKGTELVWSDKKRRMGMPLSVTRYYLVRKPGSWFKVFSDIGLTYSELEEINLYRICDISFYQSLFGKMFNTGTVVLKTNDETNETLTLKNVKNPLQVRNLFTEYVEAERKAHNVRVSELHTH